MGKVLVVFGTRPEVIKMAPLIFALKESRHLEVVSCATAQHRQLLDQVLQFFAIRPDIDLNLMRENQGLSELTSRCVTAMSETLKTTAPDLVLVQGDTTTAFVAALAAFYQQVPVGHVEAGLRTANKYAPFPEEINRRMISTLADYHFAPTALAVQNLSGEKIDGKTIYEVGNTGIDALLWASRAARTPESLSRLYKGKKLILLTMHRRESFGPPAKVILAAVKEFLAVRPDCHILYPVHPNPNVKAVATELLAGVPNISMVPPLAYGELVSVLRECQFVLTDSGGLQEEAPTFGKPVLILRETTERQEAVNAGCAKIVGYDRAMILSHMAELADSTSGLYLSMAQAKNPFGNGTAAKQIVEILETSLAKKKAA